MLVDGEKCATQRFDGHQEVIDHESHRASVVSGEHVDEDHTVKPSPGVIAHENGAGVGGE